MRNFLLIVVLFFATLTFSQESIVVIISVKDANDNVPVRNAEMQVKQKDSTHFYSTNSLGQVSFKSRNDVNLVLTLSHYKYEGISVKRKISSKNQSDTISYVLKMKFIREQNLNTMYVSAPGVPKVVYGSDELHVSDFEILPNGELLLLTYAKQLKKGSQLLIYDEINVKNSFEVPQKAEELIQDYRGNAHIVCEKSVYGVHVLDNSIGLSQVEKNYYMRYIAPIVDTNMTKMFFSNFNKDYPAFDYFIFEQKDSTYAKLLEIKDDLMMEHYRSEYKWVDVRTQLWARNKEIQTGIDAEIWVGANYFTRSIYYKELYAPMFQKNDTLYVFDYYKDKLKSFDTNGNKLDSIPIYYHYNKRKTGWKRNMVQDQKTGELYVVFERAGWTYIGWVNVKTGKINQQVKLKFRYVHDVAISNNHVYYIYRPYESAQKKYLYKERLPYDFGEQLKLTNH
tara:strand:- start:1502 stop:2857 length:1356 start_codon:yes stop_codon:yes gene_type:complete